MGFCAGDELSDDDEPKDRQGMNAFQKAIIGVCAAAVVGAAWLGRFTVVASPAGDHLAAGYLLDRWTGRVTHLHAAHDARPYVRPAEAEVAPR